MLYASSWLLTAFSADFPLFFSARVMDVILSDCYDGPIMKARVRPCTTPVTAANAKMLGGTPLASILPPEERT